MSLGRRPTSSPQPELTIHRTEALEPAEVAVTSSRTVGTVAIALALALSACSHSPLTQDDAVARIDSGTALNTHSGTYRVADVRVTLVKVVSLPDHQVGLRFSFDSTAPNCCSLFPRIALASGSSGAKAVPSTSIVILSSDIAADGTLEMRLSKSGGTTVSFTINLRRLGVRVP
jgi:hypothetical protein